MKPARLLIPFLLLAAGLPAADSTATKADKAADSYERAKSRIAVLLGPRTKPPPLPANLPNPFATASLTVAEPDPAGQASPAPAVPELPQNPLARLLPLLKISGTLRLGDVPHVIINSTPVKEGDSISVRDGETTHRLRIKSITTGHVTLEMDDAEISLPIR